MTVKTKLDKSNVEDLLSLTPLQEGMLYHYINEPFSDQYIEQLTLRLTGHTQPAIAQKAWEFVVRSNEMLRTIYRWEGLDHPIQVVLKEQQSSYSSYDISHLDAFEQQTKLEQMKQEERTKGFDLRFETIRVRNISLSDTECELIITNHHLIYDGWSNGIILKEFLDAYDCFSKGDLPVSESKTKYKEYIQWLNSLNKQEQLEFWRRHLESFETKTALPVNSNTQKQISSTELYSTTYPLEFMRELQDFATKNQVTMASLFYTTWGLLLAKYNRTNDVLFGTTVSGRSHVLSGLQKAVGLYINTLPLRVQIGPNTTIYEILKNVQQHLIERSEFEGSSLTDIQSTCREIEGELFDSLVVLENYPLDEVLGKQDREINITSYETYERTHYDVTLQIHMFEKLEVQFVFNKDLFSKELMKRMTQHFEYLLQQLISYPESMLRDIEIVRGEEKECILHSFNQQPVYNSAPRLIHQLFEDQAEAIPNQVALRYQNQSLTYFELNGKANQLARALAEKGVGPGSFVGIMVDRSPEMIISILAVFKAGAAYVPILADFPEERISYILKESNIRCLLIHQPTFQKQETFLDSLHEIALIHLDSFIYEGESTNLKAISTAQDLAYMMYTSGSTGIPKGVMIEHRSILNTLEALQVDYPLLSSDTYLLKTTFTFDVSVCELFGWIFGGGSLAILEAEAEKEPNRLVEAIQTYEVTHINFVPSLLTLLLQELSSEQLKRMNSLRYVFVAGEAMNVQLVQQFYAVFPDKRLENLYGPTETTIYATQYSLMAGKEYLKVPIGKPLANVEMLILDEHDQLSPIGVSGELCIGGAGLARGYFNNPKLTEEVFINHPFKAREKLYRTGDLARWLPDGNIEYLGRLDYQVKVRGFRIELGEIEAKLLSHPNVLEAVVIDRKNESSLTELYAYYVSDNSLNQSTVREYLYTRLPGYMVPAYFISMEKMPLSPNGKLDRKNLPQIDPSIQIQSESKKPRNEVEQALVNIWQDILGVENIGIEHHFFELGGDSIKAMKVASRLAKYKMRVEIKHILLQPTIAKLSSFVKLEDQVIEQGAIYGNVRLTPIQRLFFDSCQTERQHFNQSVMLYASTGLEEKALHMSVQKVVEHHDALRMIYALKEKEVIQTNLSYQQDESVFEVISLQESKDTDIEIERLADGYQMSFNLEKGPLFKACLFKTQVGDYLLLLAHHLVVDGVSWRIIIEDIALAYKQALNTKPLQLPEKTHSFKKWSEALHQYAKSDVLKTELSYWGNIEKINNARLIPIQSTEVASNKIKDTSQLSVSFSPEKTQQLLKEVHTAFHTQIEDVLLTALGISLKKLTFQDQFLIFMEGHGRQEIAENLNVTRTVGWFTSLYPVALDMSAISINSFEDTLPAQLMHIKEAQRSIPNKGIGYGLLKYLTGKVEGDFTELSSIPEISFNYLGEFDHDIPNDVFELSSASTGKEASSEIERVTGIEMIGSIKNGSLTFHFIYNHHLYSEAQISRLSMEFQQELIRVVDFCIHLDERFHTPSDFPLANVSMEELMTLSDQIQSMGKSLENLYPLSPPQDGILFHSLKDSSSDAYFQQVGLNIEGKLDLNLLLTCLNEMTNRYDILRTIFIYEKMQTPHQAVISKQLVEWNEMDLSHLHKEEQQKELQLYLVRDRQISFELQQSTPFRVMHIILGTENSYLLLSYHHLIMDGWSIGILFKELIGLYKAALKSDYTPHFYNRQISDNSAPYSNYIQWLQNREEKEARSFWSDYLNGYDAQVSLPAISAGERIENEQHETISFTLSQQHTRALGELALQQNTTLNTVFQAVWAVLLQKYNQTNDVVFGTVISGRSPEVSGIEQMVGLFINTIPLRVKCADHDSFLDLVSQIHQSNAQIGSFDSYSLAEINALSTLKQGLFNHIMIFENYPLDKALFDSDALDFKVNEVDIFEETNYDFNILIFPEDNIRIELKYKPSIYEQFMVEKVQNHLQHLIHVIASAPTTAIKELSVLTEHEKAIIMDSFNATQVDYPADLTIHQYFEQQARKYAASTAIIDGDKQLTYQEFNEKSNQLARYLRDKGVKNQSIVPLVINRSLDMMIGVMGILKAGGAYLPIDPDFPADRVQYMLDDSQARIVLTNSNHFNWVNDLVSMSGDKGSTVVSLDQGEYLKEESRDLDDHGDSQDLAYVIYTSGSTGKPKGTMIQHHSVINRIHWMQKAYPLHSEDIILQKTPYTFDVSVWELFWWFFQGAKVCLLEPGGEKNPDVLVETIRKQRVTTLHFVPSMLHLFLDYVEQMRELDSLASLDKVFASGEALKAEHVTRFKDSLHQGNRTRLINLYGPTEATVDVTHFECRFEEDYSFIPIGKPIDNIQLFILDQNQHLQPIGIAGELCIAGAGVARGYLNRPELTASRFVSHPFKKESKIYRTGDLARWLPDGNIEYLGRMDHQVKIRGFRIELEEIEAELSQITEISQAVVLDQVDTSGEKFLVAYIIDSSTSIHRTKEIKDLLALKLPEYMIPAFIVQVDHIPLTTNGKMNRKALLELELTQDMDTEIIGPRNETEEQLVEIWRNILQLDHFGVEQDFFSIGGHSLKAMTLVSAIHKAFKVRYPLNEVFNNPTVAKMAEYISRAKADQYISIATATQKEYYPASSMQKRMFVLSQLDENGTNYNITNTYKLVGSLDLKRLEKAWQGVVDRHESLRTSFIVREGETLQFIRRELKTYIDSIPVCEPVEKAIRMYVQRFDLSETLHRFGVLSVAPNEHYLVIDIHHTIIDGTSIGIMMDELFALYQGQALPPVKLQYKDYSESLNQPARQELLQQQEDFWLRELSGELPILNLSLDFPRPAVRGFQGSTVRLDISTRLAQHLQQLAENTGTTLYMILLAGFNVLLSKYTSQQDIIIGSPTSGRTHADVQSTIGMFVNTLALRNELKGDESFERFLAEVKNGVLKALDAQDYPFEQLVEKLNIERDMSRNPVFDVMFIHQIIDQQNITFDQCSVQPYGFNQGVARFDLSLTSIENEQKLHLIFEYSSALFERTTIERMAQHFLTILESVSSNPHLQLADINMLDEQERDDLVSQFNPDPIHFPEQAIHALFEEQARQHPQQEAIRFGQQSLTYQELNEKANQVAHALRDRGVQREELVGIMVERSLEMLVGVLGILKAGAAYVPLDPEYPAERIQYLLEDSQTTLVLTQGKWRAKIDEVLEIRANSSSLQVDILLLEGEAWSDYPTDNPEPVNDLADLAYVIYTSGSTGNPKGVMIEQSSLMNTLWSLQHMYPMTPQDAYLLKTTYTFDVSVTEMFGWILGGAMLIILPPEAEREPRLIAEHVEQHQITHLNFVPSMLQQMLLLDQESLAKLEGLTYLFVAGEALSVELAKKTYATMKQVRLENLYGPTEATIYATGLAIDRERTGKMSIGHPLSNTEAYILDEQGKLQ
ncbi:amino acid adenylation domain-containing protein, partial [Bacillus horti]|uniref:amino acid adenylation domain-containing protein n=1 Tax=Caldalkalibacillus horti TaxID=77523 RepID=UPI0031E025A4